MSTSKQGLSTRYTFAITFFLGFAFSLTLIKSAWDTAIERKQRDFNFEILSIQQEVARNILTGNDITNNVAAYVSSNENVTLEQFNSFAGDIFKRFNHVEAINLYKSMSDEWVNEFPLSMKINRDNVNNFLVGEDIYVNSKYRDAIDTAIESGSVVPAPPEEGADIDRKYWLFKAVYLKKDSDAIKKKRYQGVVPAIVSVLVSPTRLLGEKGKNSNLTITMFSDTSNLYGRQLLYFSDPDEIKDNSIWKVDTLSSEKLIHLPPYSIKIIIEKNLYFSELEYHLIFIAMLIGLGILMLLYGLTSAKAKQQKELELRNKLIEQQVEEQTHELAIARDEALQAVKTKSEFLASMSHEIRTPLNAIIGMSDLLSETKLTDEQHRYVNVFRKAGDALLTLVNDILDLSKIEAGQFVLEEIQFNLVEVVEEAADIYSIKAADKNIEIISYIDSSVQPTRVGDPGRIKQVMLNLINNALKFTESGKILVSLKQHPDHSNNSVLLSVRDTGIGINENKLDTIFESFTQADTSTTRRFGGTGLGLTICRHLVGLMNGKIWVESELDKGSEFFVEIALESIEQQADDKPVVSLNDKQALVIDAIDDNCDSICESLKLLGINCKTMTNIGSLDKTDNSDVIIVDSRFIIDEQHNKNDIFDALKKKIVVTVNPAYIGDHPKLIDQHGFYCAIIKPIKRNELLLKVSELFSDNKSELEVEQKTDNNNSIAQAKKILLVEDNPDNRLLIQAYLKKTMHEVVEAENGQIAVDKFIEHDFDIVFMDIQMPVMDGHEATRTIREWEQENNKTKTPIIALTAHAIKEEIDKCLASGCDFHLGKPIKKKVLLQTIEDIN